MRVTLPNLQQIEGVSQPIANTFRRMKVAIQTGWNQQHHGDGSHTDITASSISVSGLVEALGRVRLGTTVRYEDLGIIASGRIDNLAVAGLKDATVLKVRIAAAAITLTGIDATGREPGDLLLLINDDLHVAGPGPDFDLAANDANSAVANRFIGSGASRTPWTLHGSEGVLLMYDTFSNSGQSEIPGWRVITGAI